jgi:hypothetical protein
LQKPAKKAIACGGHAARKNAISKNRHFPGHGAAIIVLVGFLVYTVVSDYQ